ncbi:MAG: amidohydrolase [Blautia sp.]|nr:amidohydrolase [Blautia sp.]
MANLILYNGCVHPGSGDVAEAVAIRENRIEALGSNEMIRALASPGCTQIDLGGRCVLPGFIDTHCHVMATGIEAVKLPLRGASSIAELIRRGRAFIEEQHIPEGAWIYGGGYDHNVFPEGRQPDRHDLDAISTKHAILIERVCGHIGAANTLALEQAGFDEHTVITGEGGIMPRDPDGHLSGVLVETALDVIKRRMPRTTLEEAKAAVRRTFREASRVGLTSMHTDDLEIAPFDIMYQAYQEIIAEGDATVRIWEEVQCPRPDILNSFLERGLRTGDGHPFFKIGNIKLLTDGSLGARTAFMRADYSDDSGNRGVNVYTQEALDEMALLAHRAGMQIACHAIGDGAIAQCVHALGAAWRSDGVDLRNRIVHCQFPDGAMLDEMARNHICADVQPAFVASDYPIVTDRIGSRDQTAYSWRTMLEKGILIGGSSDSPVETFDPIWGIHCAVNRTDADDLPAGGWHPEERLTTAQAVDMFTHAGACLSLEEHEKGRLKPGFLADLAVLDKDIYTVPAEEIRYCRNVMTVSDGRIVYRDF